MSVKGGAWRTPASGRSGSTSPSGLGLGLPLEVRPVAQAGGGGLQVLRAAGEGAGERKGLGVGPRCLSTRRTLAGCRRRSPGCRAVWAKVSWEE